MRHNLFSLLVFPLLDLLPRQTSLASHKSVSHIISAIHHFFWNCYHPNPIIGYIFKSFFPFLNMLGDNSFKMSILIFTTCCVKTNGTYICECNGHNKARCIMNITIQQITSTGTYKTLN